MSELLKTVLSLSLSGTLLMLALFLLNPLVKGRMSLRWQYYIWLVVLVRLLLPVAPETNAVGALFDYLEPARSEARQVLPTDENGAAESGAVPPDGNKDGEPATPNGAQEAAYPVDLTTILPRALGLVWLLGAGVLLLRKISVYQSFIKHLKAGCTEASDPTLLARLARLRVELGIKRPVGLSVNGLIASPLLLGVFRPRIVLPTAALPDTDLTYTLLHELTHLKRGDLLYQWLVQITVCLHWFNPLVYWMNREISRLRELSCDEAVIRKRGARERREYGATLLRALAQGGNYRETPSAVTLGEGKELMKERLEAIMNNRGRTRLTAVVAVAAACMLCVGAATAGAYTGPPQLEARAESAGFRNGTGGPVRVSGFYEAPYVFELGWNMRTTDRAEYKQTVQITLQSGAAITVAFHKDCASFAREKAVEASLTALMEQLVPKYAATSYPIREPFVLAIEYVGGKDLDALAEEYYAADKISFFGAIIGEVSGQKGRELLEKTYQDDDVAFFSVASKRMDAETAKAYADRAFQEQEEGKLPFFSVALNEYQELGGTTGFEDYLEEAYRRNEVGLFSVALDYMGAQDIVETYARRAYADKELAMFSVIASSMTDAQRAAWREKAARDGKTDFLSVL